MFAGYDPHRNQDDIVYLIINAFWEAAEVELPGLPEGLAWQMEINTGAEGEEYRDIPLIIGNSRVAGGRTLRPDPDGRKERQQERSS